MAGHPLYFYFMVKVFWDIYHIAYVYKLAAAVWQCARLLLNDNILWKCNIQASCRIRCYCCTVWLWVYTHNLHVCHALS